MKVLVIGPSETRSRGGMAAVIRGIRESKQLNKEFDIDIFPSYIDGSLPIRLLYSLYGYLRFLRCYRSYDLFHIHMAERGSTFRKRLYLKKGKSAGKKVILHIHGAEYLDFYDGLRGRKKQMAEECFRQADQVLALSESWKRALEARFPIDTCKVLNNGIDIAKFSAIKTDVIKYRNSFLLLGRLGVRKGVYDLIDAVEIAVRQNPDLSVRMAGDGGVEKVQELVAKKGLEKHITVLGWSGEAEKLKYLSQAGTVVLPSYQEGLPMFLLEGMAAGRAVISTTVGAIPEAVKEENGILIEPGDVSALAEALLRCSGDIGLLASMSEQNRERAERLFSVRQMHKRLAEYYRELGE